MPLSATQLNNCFILHTTDYIDDYHQQACITHIYSLFAKPSKNLPKISNYHLHKMKLSWKPALIKAKFIPEGTIFSVQLIICDLY